MSSKPVALVKDDGGRVDIERLIAPFPATAIKRRVIGGGRSADYIDGATVIRRLNDATGFEWSFTVDRYWTEGNVNLALVTLTLPGMGSRQHIGVQNATGSGEDASAKGAITDALKKAATLFGVGLELQGPDYEAGEISGSVERPAPVQNAAQRPRQAPAPSAAPSRTPTPQPAPPQATGPSKPPTPMQRLHGHANGRKLSSDDVHALALFWHSKASRTQLTPGEINGMIAAFDPASGQALDDETLATEIVKAYEAVDALKATAPAPGSPDDIAAINAIVATPSTASDLGEHLDWTENQRRWKTAIDQAFSERQFTAIEASIPKDKHGNPDRMLSDYLAVKREQFEARAEAQ